MTAPEATGNAARYADLDDRVLADALEREDDFDDAVHAGGSGTTPRRDTCHPCRTWADHDHHPTTGARVELSDVELEDRADRTVEHALRSDAAHDPDPAAWGYYERLVKVAEERVRRAEREVER